MSSFKVIIAGGGPVGLTAAHALTKAGIDFLVLERRPNVVIDAGSNLVLSPVGLRTLAQLGLAKDVDAVSSELGLIDRVDHSGRRIADLHLFEQIKRNFGLAPRVISRHDLTKVLYETLPADAQEKILSNKKLSDIALIPDGVVATCEDGSMYSGSTLLGADGAHSIVRDLMRSLAIKSGSTKINKEKPFLTTYRALWIRFPKLPGLSVGTTSETHGYNAATQLFVGEESGVMGLYERLEEPTSERIRHTQADQEDIISRWGHLPLISKSGLTLNDIYVAKQEAGLVSLEEGVVDNWSLQGRIALVGDAAHKYTPSTGAGCNTGMTDIVVIVNELHKAKMQAIVSRENPNGSPTKEALEAAFQAYQDARQASVANECASAHQATTMATWQSPVYKFIDRRVIHRITGLLISLATKRDTSTPTMNFITSDSAQEKETPWVTTRAEISAQA